MSGIRSGLRSGLLHLRQIDSGEDVVFRGKVATVAGVDQGNGAFVQRCRNAGDAGQRHSRDQAKGHVLGDISGIGAMRAQGIGAGSDAGLEQRLDRGMI